MTRYLVVATLAAMFCSCMASPQVQVYHHYPPTQGNLDVYQTQTPTRKCQEVGRIELGDTDDDYCMAMARQEAHRLGADGMIILGRSGSLATLAPVGAITLAESSPYGIVAVAIKYTE